MRFGRAKAQTNVAQPVPAGRPIGRIAYHQPPTDLQVPGRDLGRRCGWSKPTGDYGIERRT